MGGKPCIRGMRMTVYDVLDYLASGMTDDEIPRDFPDLTREDLRACLAFAADRERRLAGMPGGIISANIRTLRGSFWLAASQDGGHHPRAAAAMHQGNYKHRSFIRRVGNRVIAHAVEAQWREVRSGRRWP